MNERKEEGKNNMKTLKSETSKKLRIDVSSPGHGEEIRARKTHGSGGSRRAQNPTLKRRQEKLSQVSLTFYPNYN